MLRQDLGTWGAEISAEDVGSRSRRSELDRCWEADGCACCACDLCLEWCYQGFVPTEWGPYRDHSGPLGPKAQKKSRKKVPGGREKVEVEKNCFWLVFDRFFRLLFQPFSTPGPRGPGNLFSNFSGFRARRARMTPVRGQGDCNGPCECVDHRHHCCRRHHHD